MDAERRNVAIHRGKFEAILKRTTLPSEFRRVGVAYGPDQDGDASVSLPCRTADGVQISDDNIPRLSQFISSVVSALCNGNVDGYA